MNTIFEMAMLSFTFFATYYCLEKFIGKSKNAYHNAVSNAIPFIAGMIAGVML